MSRLITEMIVILSVFMFCVLYGAVSVRDASVQSFDAVNADIRPGPADSGNAALPSAERPALPDGPADRPSVVSPQSASEQTAATDVPKSSESSGLLQTAGERLADQISRFFLWGVGVIAGFFESILNLAV